MENLEVKEALGAIVESTKSQAAKIKTIEDQQSEMRKEVTSIGDSLIGIKQKGVGLDNGFGSKAPSSMGRNVIEDENFKLFTSKQVKHARIEMKNTILGEGGSPQDPVDTIVPYQHVQGIVGGAFRELTLLDVLPVGTATSNTIHYTREASWTNSAAERAEGTQKPESTLTFEDVNAPVRTVPHFLKASRQVLDDAPALQSYIDTRMRHGVMQRLESQIIAGNGTSPNISGITTTGNHTDLTVVTADNDLDAASRAKYQVKSADFAPSFYVVNPADWGRIERKKTGIASDETPLAGAGNAVSYLANGMQPMLWGLPVITSNSMTAGSFICASRDALMLWVRQETAVELFEQNEDDVEKNLVTIRAEGRFAFTVFRPAAVIVGAWPEAS
jgi:HK97 family phage major capsid protein